MADLENPLSRALRALRDIRSEAGVVCANYEVCNHNVCASSYSAWAVADKALRDLGDIVIEEATDG